MAFIQGQILTAAQLNTALAQYVPTGTISTYSGTLLTGTTQAAWFTALGLPAAAPGSANGLATLNASGIVPSTQLPGGLATNPLVFTATWNAATNIPALVSSTGTKGFFYFVTVAGSTNLDGNNTWFAGDCVFFDGTVWRRIAGSIITSANITDSTVAGRALLTSASALAQRVALNVDQVTLVADANQTITTAMEAVGWSSLTTARTASMPSVASMNSGQSLFIYDESGSCSPANTITINPNGADKINNATSYTLRDANSGAMLIRGSAGKLTALPFSPSTPGYRNRIINGDMRVDQRNVGAGLTVTTATPLYGVDRWKIVPTGASVTGQRVAGSGSSQYRYQLTGAASVTGITIEQAIEAANCYDLNGQTVTISADLADSLLTTVTWKLSYANTTDNWGASTQIATGTFTVTSAVARYQVQVAVPGAATTGLLLALSVGAQTSGTFTVGNVQLETGYLMTAFERIPVSESLQLCQRYYAKSYSQGAVPGSAVSAGGGGVFFTGASSTIMGGHFRFPMTMRVLPAVTFYDNAGTSGVVSYFSSAWTNGGSNTGVASTDSAANCQITGGASAVSVSFDYTAAAELI